MKSTEIVHRRREAASAIKLYHMVRMRVPGELTTVEYDRAVRYTIHKYPDLTNRSRGTGMDSQNVEYLAALVAEAAGQARIESGIIEMAHAAQELEQHEFMERNETA